MEKDKKGDDYIEIKSVKQFADIFGKEFNDEYSCRLINKLEGRKYFEDMVVRVDPKKEELTCRKKQKK